MGKDSRRGSAFSLPPRGCGFTAGGRNIHYIRTVEDSLVRGMREGCAVGGLTESKEARVHSGFHTAVRADSSAMHSVCLYLVADPQPAGQKK